MANNSSNIITCSKIRPVCLNVPISSSSEEIQIISKCDKNETTNIEILDYILDEIRTQNNNAKKYINPSNPIDNCYSTDNAWLVVIKNMQRQLLEIKTEDIKNEMEEIQNDLNNNDTIKPIIPQLNLMNLFKKIIEVAKSKWNYQNKNNNNKNNNKNNKNSQIKKQIIDEFVKVVNSNGFEELSNLINKLLQGKTELMNKLKTTNNNQHFNDEQITNYKTIIENLFLYTLPIMNSETDLSNVFGRDFSKINEDFNEINNMLELFNKKNIYGGSKYNKKTKKNNGKGKRKNTYTKKNMRGGDIGLIIVGVIVLFIILVRYNKNGYIRNRKRAKKNMDKIKREKEQQEELFKLVNEKLIIVEEKKTIIVNLFDKINEMRNLVKINETYDNVMVQMNKLLELLIKEVAYIDNAYTKNNQTLPDYIKQKTQLFVDANSNILILLNKLNKLIRLDQLNKSRKLVNKNNSNCKYQTNDAAEVLENKESIDNILKTVNDINFNTNLDFNEKLFTTSLGKLYKKYIEKNYNFVKNQKVLLITFYENLDCNLLKEEGEYIYVNPEDEENTEELV
jgi:hypothetical protein